MDVAFRVADSFTWIDQFFVRSLMIALPSRRSAPDKHSREGTLGKLHLLIPNKFAQEISNN